MNLVSNDANLIIPQMARIRRKHHDDIAEAFVGAETAAGWARYIRRYSWAALGAAAVFWMVSNRSKKVPMNKENCEIVARHQEEITETEPTVVEPLTARPSLLGEAASFLTTVAVRAAQQNYAVYCLEEWITPRRMLGASEGSPLRPIDDSPMPDGHHLRPGRPKANGDCEDSEMVLLAKGTRDD